MITADVRRSGERRRRISRGRRCGRAVGGGGVGGGGDGFQQTLECGRRASVLQTLVRGQAVLGPVPPPAEFTNVKRVGLIVLVLEVSFQRVIAAERPLAVRTVLWLVDAAVGWRW